jgi:DNA-binding NarL/FixJ family response regulator
MSATSSATRRPTTVDQPLVEPLSAREKVPRLIVAGLSNPKIAGRLVIALGAVNYKRWKNILQFIETNYPGVFAPDWQVGWGIALKVQVFLHADP